MMMFKPNKRHIRRSFENGLWLQYKTSPHQVQFHAKINRPRKNVGGWSCVPNNPIAVRIVSADRGKIIVSADRGKIIVSADRGKIIVSADRGKIVSADRVVRIVFAAMCGAKFPFIKDKVDQGFLNNLLEMFSADQDVTSEQQINELVHLSFSLQGGGDQVQCDKRVPAECRCRAHRHTGRRLQREHMFYNNKQLTGEMTGHYAGQAVKQMYVLVLGLDVLGNPFGLLRGMAEGMQDLFYEPYQLPGAIQGPEEFAEGMMLGLGLCQGSQGPWARGSQPSHWTMSIRRSRPANVGEGFARGGKGLVMGFTCGGKGLVMIIVKDKFQKITSGAKKEGVEGFFKGVGKGLVGVVTRPTSGVIDFASSSFEGIKRFELDLSPRRFHKDGIIRPYNRQEAEGCAVLMCGGGRYLIEDYVAHVVVTKDNKNVFLVTNKRLLFASRGEIFGSWNCEFTYIWAELKEKPKVTTKGIEVTLKEKEKRGLFGSSISKKEIHHHYTRLFLEKTRAIVIASASSDIQGLGSKKQSQGK
ncbi:hypothetical protein DPMN_029085 [Dreissena polymorpha]|uniref:Intermembrane lipid transfer protein VPS13-like C-terminal domain-containing protein n=1 Tax=Dreissena polymorpha TaxID=45954 RepID=A0A9D4LYD3_DREPO|nr:hypothetical protein DPMN_029085 [Dreissena polymorpha]